MNKETLWLTTRANYLFKAPDCYIIDNFMVYYDYELYVLGASAFYTEREALEKLQLSITNEMKVLARSLEDVEAQLQRLDVQEKLP